MSQKRAVRFQVLAVSGCVLFHGSTKIEYYWGERHCKGRRKDSCPGVEGTKMGGTCYERSGERIDLVLLELPYYTSAGC
jgi:hypothetical protein